MVDVVVLVVAADILRLRSEGNKVYDETEVDDKRQTNTVHTMNRFPKEIEVASSCRRWFILLIGFSFDIIVGGISDIMIFVGGPPSQLNSSFLFFSTW